uniref:La-related protein 6B n=1 Tax=Quercus lobata TaxID=97700 RepID=A0A7N2MUR0_QUELO
MAQEDSSPDPSPSPPNLSDPSKPDPPPPSSSSSSSSSSLSRNVSFSRLNAQAPEFVPTQQQAPRLAAASASAAVVPPPPPPPPPMHSFPPPPPPPPFHVAAAIQGHVAVPPHVIPVQHPHHVPVQYHPHHPHHPHPHPHHHHQQYYGGGGGGGGGGFREQEVGTQVQNQAPVESDHVVAAASSSSAKNKISEEATQKILNQVRHRGIGIRCLRRFNSALLAKWLWRYGLENDALWRRVIGAKYGNEWGGWCKKSVSGAYGVCLWKFIRSGWGNFSKFIRTRNALVSEVMCFVNGRVSWDIQFCRLVNDQESQSLDSFMVLIYSTKVRGVGSDNLCWKPANNQGFKVWGICRSSPPSLSYSLCDVEYDLLLAWYLLGDASKGSGFVGLLDMQIQASSGVIDNTFGLALVSFASNVEGFCVLTWKVEYYFSDLNLATTDHLMRFISKDSEGFVPISVVASFKKIKALISSHSQLAAVLRNSSKLVVSEDGKKVRRQRILTESEMEELQSRIVVAENLPEDHCHQNLMKVFSAVGSVKTIRTCQPQPSNGGASSASRSGKADGVLYSNKWHAFVEYESVELAEKAVAELNEEGNWRRGLRVRLMLRRTSKPSSARGKKGHDGEVIEEDDTSTSDQQQSEKQLEDPPQQSDAQPHEQTGEEQQHVNEKDAGQRRGRNRGRGKGRGRGQYHHNNHHNNRGNHVGTPPSNNAVNNEQPAIAKQPPGPRMPDGTRGFAMGRGKPLAVNIA